MGERTCGSCTACCKTHPIAHFNNPAGVWCRFCDVGKGCGIYQSRPQECKDFQCEWLQGYLTENQRPDLVNIVVGDFDAPGFGPMLALYEVRPGALNGNFAQQATEQMIQRERFILHLPLTGVNKIYVPAKYWGKYRDGQGYPNINTRRTFIVHYKSGK